MLKGLANRLEQMQEAPLPPYEGSISSTYLDFNAVSLAVLNQITTSINSIGQNIAKSITITNKHFETPKPVDPFYTGREAQAKSLQEWLLPPTSRGHEESLGKGEERQKRFVIYGVGGAGKTQFCCKFAEDNREK